MTHGTHQFRFGGRIRGVNQDTQSTSNYNGMYTFSGGRVTELDANYRPILDAAGQPVQTTLTSIDLYRQTQLLLQNGFTAAQIRAFGYGPNQFSITGGQPLSGVGQFDLGFFAQDDWRLKPNFTLSLGVRYETQNNIGDHGDIAPRVGLAWAPGARKGASPKTVIRAGFGIFFDRFTEDYTLNAIRLNGITQQQFVIRNPDFYPEVPTATSLAAAKIPQAIREVDAGLVAPRIAQTAIGFERQLPKHVTLSMNYANSRGTHQLRSRNINAPLSATYNPLVPGSGDRPYGSDAGDLYLYESSGVFRQNQLITSVQARMSPKFTMFGFYVFGKAESNGDGANNFPANQYDLKNEWSRASFDVRHRAFIGGSLTGPWNVQMNPFIIMNSAAPFNITTGRDINGDSLFTDRPAFATDLSRPSVVQTAYGNFDVNPIAGQTIIPRNYGDSHPNFSVNLRLSRSWGFGERKSAQGAGPFGDFGGGGGGPRGGGGGGPRGGGGGGGPVMIAGGGPRGMFGGGGAGNSRFVLTASVSARNALNHVNPGAPVGDLSSRLFGQSTGIAGGFGPGGPGGAAGNRRIEIQLRLSF
jgi:hypothetical protein